MSDVRICRPADLPEVARLFQKVFRKKTSDAPPALVDYLEELFFHDPSYDPERSSRVYDVGGGKLRGFIGILPIDMEIDGTPRKAAIAGSLMVENPQEDPTAGARLFRSFLKGAQDLAFSETVNETSKAMWLKSGGEVSTSLGLEWVYVFRPHATFVSLLKNKVAPAGALMPIAAIGDWTMAKQFHTLNKCHCAKLEKNALTGEEVDADALAVIADELTAAMRIRPRWSRLPLAWRIEHAKQKKSLRPLVARAVLDRTKKVIGAYVCHMPKGHVARALLLVAEKGKMPLVVSHMFSEAYQAGCAAMRGRAGACERDALLEAGALMFERSALVYHTKDKNIREACLSGEGIVSGLAGEVWNRLIGDVF